MLYNKIEQGLFKNIVPERTKSYTPIPHGDFITAIHEIAEDLGMTILDKKYMSDKSGNKVTGKYTLGGGDSEMGSMIAFQNSYDKSMTAKFAIGASVFICSNGMVTGDYTIKRKHTGDADQLIKSYIEKAMIKTVESFEDTIDLRDQFKREMLSEAILNEMVGELFLHKDILRIEQLSMFKQEYNNPTHNYGVHKNNVWNLYNICTFIIENRSHPSMYFKQHQNVIDYFLKKFFS